MSETAALAAQFLTTSSRPTSGAVIERARKANKAREKSLKNRYKQENAVPAGAIRSAPATASPSVSRAGTAQSTDNRAGSPLNTLAGGDDSDDSEEERERNRPKTKEELEMEAMEAKFEQQMLEMELNEKWEASVDKIPEIVRDDFKDVMLNYSVFTKIKLYKLLDQLQWSIPNSKKLLHILQVAAAINAPQEKVDWWLNKMKEYEDHGYLEFAFNKFMTAIDDSVVEEIFSVTDDDYMDRCMELARFLNDIELNLMLQ